MSGSAGAVAVVVGTLVVVGAAVVVVAIVVVVLVDVLDVVDVVVERAGAAACPPPHAAAINTAIAPTARRSVIAP